MFKWVALIAILSLSNLSAALDRNIIRRSILTKRHAKSKSLQLLPLHFEDIAVSRQKRAFPSDDEDLEDGSGESDFISTTVTDRLLATESTTTTTTTVPRTIPPTEDEAPGNTDWVWYRTKINFLDSIVYNDSLKDYHTPYFTELSDQIMMAVETELNEYIDGYLEATPLMYIVDSGDVMVLVDVGMCMVHSITEVKNAMMSLVGVGRIGDFRVSEEGFSIRQIGVDHERSECHNGNGDDYYDEIFTTTSNVESAPTQTVNRITEPTPPDATDYITSTAAATTTTPPRRRPVTSAPCREDQATCHNKQCIDRSYVCDGTRDCIDGSDEPPSCAVTSTSCEPTQFLCVGTDICVSKVWRCDGDDDCGNNYDEQNCPTSSPSVNETSNLCESTHFECDGGCIPKSFQCDGESDCDDGSDEEGCTAPVVIKPPTRILSAHEGETVTLDCEAVGGPTPVITWRVNWGNVPPPPRVTMESANGKGTLTIRKVKPSDQGAYTCEAINPVGGILGVPDAILTVEEREDTEPQPCPEGMYDTSSDSDDGTGNGDVDSENSRDICKPCFCFGVTNQCRSSHLEYKEVGIVFTEPDNIMDVEVVPAETEGGKPTTHEPINRNQILVNPPAKELQLIDLSKRFLAAAHYWSLPAQFLGAKIDSYGGTLTYSFSYNNSYNFDPQATDNSDVILEGKKGDALIYRNKDSHPEPKNKHTETVKIEEKNFEKPDGSPATKEDVLTVLSDVKSILIRTVYDQHMLSTGIGDVKLQTAGSSESVEGTYEKTGQIATLVEECECPDGYQGLSCEECAPGFERIKVGPFIGTCERVECDKGYTGDDCTQCAEGYKPHEGECTEYPTFYCDKAGSIGMAFDGKCDCKTGCEGVHCDRCKPGYFYLSEDNVDGCIPCFCSGVSEQCDSSSWNRTVMSPSHNSDEVFSLSNALSSYTTREYVSLDTTSNNRQYVVTAQLDQLPLAVYYWLLPREFNGDKLTSYGSYLDYTINYQEGQGGRQITRIADVKLIGNGVILEYLGNPHPHPNIDNRYTIEILEDKWLKSDGSQTTRADLLTVLSNIDSFLIRATYSNRVTTTKLTNLYLGTAEPIDNGRSQALQVEQCVCPEGYTGFSCQECDGGYVRVSNGPYLGNCQRCNCNGHSNDCDLQSGICTSCKHNTYGDHCDLCASGFYGDARRGLPGDCKPCPCPSIEDRNDHGSDPTCSANGRGEPVCDRCPEGYEGDRCERCSPGYVGNPFEPGSMCRVEDIASCQCNTGGSIHSTCDSSGQCICKPSTTGMKCDKCKDGYFYLNIENDGGCLPCFCMGVTTECSSSIYQRSKVMSNFEHGADGFELTNEQGDVRVSSGFEEGINELTYPRLDSLQRGKSYYWRLPDEYTGDKIVSYGGKLEYTAAYTIYSPSSPNVDADVIVRGNDITLYSSISDQIGNVKPDEPTERFVIFREKYWSGADGQPATREHLLMALADLEDILILASYSPTVLSTSISAVSMETASESALMTTPAFEVEECMCPSGYEGLSCEDCAPGYTRSGVGEHLGHCRPCQCNGHSDMCDPETGACTDCRDNTAGSQCEICARGFYNTARIPSTTECLPCACPNTGTNSFSETCEFDPANNRLTCNECQEGYVGDRCENCAQGYEGNPQSPGGFCSKTTNPDPIRDESPQVEVSPKHINARKGTDASFRCIVTSSSPARIDWRKVGGSSSALLSSERIEISDQGRTLNIRNVLSMDVGTYECVATNRHGVGRDTAVLSLSRKRPMIEVKVEEPRRLRVREGSDVSFVCTASSKMSAYIVIWDKQHGMLPLPRATDFDGILHISNVKVSDSGTYVCTGSNMYSIDREMATLEVVGESVIEMPTVIVTPNNQSVTEGQEAIIYCNAEGFPTPDIEWHRADGKPMPDGIYVTDSMLMISSASMDDKAQYYCTASNEHGIAEAVGALDVSAQGKPPIVTVLTPEVDIFVGETVILKCNATGIPEPDFTWDNQDFGLYPNAYVSDGTLRISSAVLNNAGLYSCKALNMFGEDIGYIRVTVQPKSLSTKPICRTEPKDVTAYVGHNSTINCVVGGDPPPTIRWVTKDRSPLGPNVIVEGPNMIIVDVDSSNAGQYVCVATNEGGVSESHMTLHVVKKDLPNVELAPSMNQRVTSGNDAFFTCTAPDERDADITWIRADGQPFTGETYLSESNTKLNFDNITPRESGSYICVASNVVGHREIHVYIDVIQIPVISVKPAKFIDLEEGQSVDLVCLANGVPSPSLYWRKTYASDRPPTKLTGYRKQTQMYRLSRVELADAGDYECVALNTAGSAQQVVMIMVHPKVVPKSPIVVTGSIIQTGVVGSEVQLKCVATGTPHPSIVWTKRDDELPEGSTQRKGTLTIPSLAIIDAGNYVCTATNQAGTDSSDVELQIVDIPVLAVSSGEKALLVMGESISIDCHAISGTNPISYKWTKKSGDESASVFSDGGRLQVTGFDPDNDAGVYVCSGTNVAGSISTEIVLQESKPPVVDISPRDESKLVGESVEFVCNVMESTESLDLSITWRRMDDIALNTEKTTISGGRLMISNLELSDAGEYECSASNDVGSSSISASLSVNSAPIATITQDGNSDILIAGESVTITCNATGSPDPQTTLYKDGIELIVNEFGEFLIDHVVSADQGSYKCIANNSVGKSDSVLGIIVHEPPTARIEAIQTELRSGESFVLICLANGNPTPNITWSKLGGSLSPKVVLEDGSMSLVGASESDAGVYVCTATSEAGVTQANVTILVHAFVPFFSQTPLSYITVAIHNNSFYTDFEIKLSFRPNSLSGLLVYAYGNIGDFISLSLEDGIVKFSYDTGSGPATIQSATPVSRGKWHTVTMTRSAKKGTLRLDGNEPITGVSPGEFRYLDLTSDLYIGGLPTELVASLPQPLRGLGIDVGFYGCLSQLVIDSATVDIGSSEDVLESVGVIRCKTCILNSEESPCMNGATCTESHASAEGYVCGCRSGYIGNTCQFKDSELCAAGVCGDHGKCQRDLSRELGYTCQCSGGYGGPLCRQYKETTVTLVGLYDHQPEARPAIEELKRRPFVIGAEFPSNLMASRVVEVADLSSVAVDLYSASPEEGAISFNKESYMMSRSIRATHRRKTDIELQIRRKSHSDGLLLFSESEHSNDFVSLAIRNEAPEFRIKSGRETSIIRSDSHLELGSWYLIHVVRNRNLVTMEVDGKKVAEGNMSGSKRGVRVNGDFYLGGVKFWENIPKRVNVRDGFDGCIQSLRVNKMEFPLNDSFAKKNTRKCQVDPEMQADEAVLDPVDAIFGPRHSARFSGDSYGAFSSDIFPHDGKAEQISIEFRTSSPEGLLFYHGEDVNAPHDRTRSRRRHKKRKVKRQDFISIGTQAGYLMYSFQLGGGQVQAVSQFPVADGLWHKVTIVRRGTLALMWIDDVPLAVATQAPGSHVTCDAPGRLYIGGAPSVIYDRLEHYTSGFVGCVRAVKITVVYSDLKSDLGSTYMDDSATAALDFGSGGSVERVAIRTCRDPSRDRVQLRHAGA